MQPLVQKKYQKNRLRETKIIKYKRQSSLAHMRNNTAHPTNTLVHKIDRTMHTKHIVALLPIKIVHSLLRTTHSLLRLALLPDLTTHIQNTLAHCSKQ